ncbi:MAG: DUF5928 domain-containing protein [Pseudomonadota bacterium]
MAKIAYILLCHKNPAAVVAQARGLTASGDYVTIHFDARAAREDYDQIREGLAGNDHVTFAHRRARCGWGEWSLVQATLNALTTAADAFPRATHFFMVSGDCMPIKTAEYVHGVLDKADVDHIESYDFYESDWIKTGMKTDRLIYRHFFNERKNKRLFYASYEWQKKRGLTRQIPADLQMRIGSQWWCLRRPTIEKIIEFCRARKDVARFFRTTWIPDETFFQTLVPHLVAEEEIRCRPLTFLMFTDYGMPVTFYNDHYDLLISQDYLFARKISPAADDLRSRLNALYGQSGVTFEIANEGEKLHGFLCGRGRRGLRFGQRFWQTDWLKGQDRTLMIVACKKWHVAKRLLDRVRQTTNIPAIEYLFSEENSPLPDLGGLQRSLEKRTRHRRALVGLLFDFYESDHLIICLDPSDFDLIEDFAQSRADTRILEISCDMSDAYLAGHARRIGLVGDGTPPDAIDRLLPTIRNDIIYESERLRGGQFPAYRRMAENRSAERNAQELAAFLDIELEKATEIAATEHLFVD